MIRSFSALMFVIVSSTAFAGIIGVGGTNARENPQLMDALSRARRFEISSEEFRRLSVRVGTQYPVYQEVTSTSGEKIRKDFIRVYVDRNSKIVDKDVQLDVQPNR